MSNDKRPSGEPPPMVLRAFYLLPGHSVTIGGVSGIPTSMTGWERTKHGEKLPVEERPNGDVWITTPQGTRIEISVLAISYKVRGPETLKQTDAVRRGA